MLAPLWNDVARQIVLIALGGGISLKWKLNALVMRYELFQVSRAE
jgi:hypothetical protein